MANNVAKTHTEPVWICDPTDDRCVRPISPTFLPGISVRHSPSCTGEICSIFACDGGNWRVTNQGTLDRAKWIEGWIITQLLTRGQVECEEHPLGKRDGGWWADAFRSGSSARNQFRSGSKLWALQFAHGGATNQLLMQAKQYAYEALSYLTSFGIVRTLHIDALYIAKGNKPFPGAVIQLKISISGPGVASSMTVEGQQQPNMEWLWQEYRAPVAAQHIQGRLYGRTYHGS